MLLDGIAQFVVADGLIVLRRQHDALDRNRLSVAVEESNLRFCIRPQPGQLPTAPHFGLSAHQPVRIENGRGHSLRRFIGGVTEHHALISGTAAIIVPPGRFPATDG